MRFLAIVLASLIWAAPAHADWHEASSDHFVVYANDDREDIVRFTRILEQFHEALDFLTGNETPVPSPSNRVTIYSVGSTDAVQRYRGRDSRNIAGFYLARASGSLAFVPEVGVSKHKNHFSMVVLLHEYVHHYFLSNSRVATPWWLREGSAEFFASTRFFPDGSMQIGRPADHRIAELGSRWDNRAEDLLNPDAMIYDISFYGWSWKLYHHLNFAEHRQGQLAQYISLIAQGTPPFDAAKEAFGNLSTLHRELKDSLKKTRLKTYTIKPGQLDVGEVTIRRLDEAHSSVLPLIARLDRGISAARAGKMLPELNELAADYPNSSEVWSALAWAELVAENPAKAFTASERALAIDNNNKRALITQGDAMFALAREKEAQGLDASEDFAAAMTPFSQLNALENDHTVPLMRYFDSFADRGMEPPNHAKHALERAALLSPFDDGLWMKVARVQAAEGKIDLAKASLEPIANSYHVNPKTKAAKRAMGILATTAEGTALDLTDALTLQCTSPAEGDDEDDETDCDTDA